MQPIFLLRLSGAMLVSSLVMAGCPAVIAVAAGKAGSAASPAPGGPAPAPAAAPAANLVTGGFGGVIHTRRPTLYIISLAPDVTTGAAIAVETAIYLSNYRSKSYAPLDPNYHPFHQQECSPDVGSKGDSRGCYPVYNSSPPSTLQPTWDPWFIPEPTWSVQDYVNQCISDPADTIGSLVIAAVENDSGTRNFVVWADNYSRLYADAFFITCEPHSANEYEATGSDSKLKPPLSTANPLAAAGTRVTSEQETHSMQGKSWQKTLTVAPYPTPSGPLLSTLNKTITWAGSEPATLTSSVVSYVPVPIPTPTPNMTVIWDARSNLKGHAAGGLYGGGVPLLTIAGVASYYASRTKQTTTNGPAGCTGNSGSNPCTSTQVTSPTISASFALLATSLSGLGSINVPGANPTSVLKRAASNLAQSIGYQLHNDCGSFSNGQDQDMDWMCQHVFHFQQRTPAPSAPIKP